MNQFRNIVVLSVALVLTSCSSGIQVRKGPVDTRLLPDVVTNFSTYRWGDSPFSFLTPNDRVDSEYTATIRDEVDRTLSRKGYRKIVGKNADMVIAVLLTIRDSQGFPPQNNPWNAPEYPPDYGFRWNLNQGDKPVKMEKLSAREEASYYEKGTLHVGVFDTRQKLFWHETASKIIDSSHSPETHQQVLRHTVEDILNRFPDRKPIR